MSVWPSTLPQFPDVDWREKADPQFVEFPTDSGFSKRRRRVTRERRIRQMRLSDVSGSQLATLRTFYNSTLLGGTEEFTITNGDPIGGTTVTCRFLEPFLVQQWLPASTTAARRYVVDMTLEVISVA